ncbi:hypothetical protein B0F90DRAFT_1808952 [Multifurca ochricompacta]|uniref:Hyaluronan/mRNA-binding protein domain-containing protein n=1 Tax=Multifurca ochricompacta TaxID=376703 RepID=A0AAD4QQ87_9AGAM|nr:hypothetical protein B0F90DRAFT_1808952 [Multifurca ochricompacta]
MTRTERSHSLRALIKDRSEARNGMDNSVPKGGAGAHNWGSLGSEIYFENDAPVDGDAEFEDQAKETGVSKTRPKKPTAVHRTSSVTDEDRENAIKVRKNALNGDIDLAAIARSSVAVSASPPKDNVIPASIHVS